ncbi:hypothetical protein [Chitinophaga sp. S165]|uniref:hypothetical protein n=1 Tax=Chitinophaga sp. S165 TaxID=2135462 RepID=UPI000D7162E5|nr:hypothetical protein [Chitinophaga sp. S165]PWV56688.1 hypothetical protein C7475_1011205 [Chitinophaga sp. S165]
MKLNTKYIKGLIVTGVILIAVGTFAAIPSLRERLTGKRPKEGKHIVITENNKQDKAILDELTKVLHAMDTVTILTATGMMDAQDFADSTNTLQTDFCYTRNGDQGYYRVGQNEMVSLREAYIVVAHDLKKIFVSAPKEVINPVRLPASTEAAFLSREMYKVSRAENNRLTQIALVNSKHASCREYRISFDSAAIIRSAVMRMPDPMELEDVSKDKVLKITVNSWELGVVRKDLLRMERYLTQDYGRLLPAARLKGYELIKQ